eukprot:TRINITY_DN2618_c0_g1_i1.p1 TRINITY_DN2618_c0_g1~~TRINITY_DN2618_c0_g1_i1.p1  ORF type:complete len:378 (+),score=76.88 TRINITY_DN2618_c0_g1_i1:69-1202(+)
MATNSPVLLCKMGCGRPCAIGGGYDTCCRDCAKSGGRSHDKRCRPAQQASGATGSSSASSAAARTCKMGCGRPCPSGFDTCCRRCAVTAGGGHDDSCKGGPKASGHSPVPAVVPGHVVPGPPGGHGAMPAALAGHAAPAPAMMPGHGCHGMPAGHAMPAAPGGRKTFMLAVISAKDLYDLDWTGKMDPYVKISFGGREYRTQVMTNAGRKAKFHWAQHMEWNGEPDIQFTVMDSNMLVADGVIGSAVFRGLPMQTDFSGPLELVRAHHFGGARSAGRLDIEIRWQRPGMPAMPGMPGGPAYMPHGAPGYAGGPMPGMAGMGMAGGGMAAGMAGHHLFAEALGYGYGKKKKKDKKEKKMFKVKKLKKHGWGSSSSSSS